MTKCKRRWVSIFWTWWRCSGLRGTQVSAPVMRANIDKALRFEPFSPLTGAESEWGEPYDWAGTQQSKRCSHVFRDKDGAAYDINGKVFVQTAGASLTARNNRQGNN